MVDEPSTESGNSPVTVKGIISMRTFTSVGTLRALKSKVVGNWRNDLRPTGPLVGSDYGAHSWKFFDSRVGGKSTSESVTGRTETQVKQAK